MMRATTFTMQSFLLLCFATLSITPCFWMGVHAASTLHTSTARLPQAVVSVWNDLTQATTASGGDEEETSAATTTKAYCLIGSRTLTRAEQRNVLQTLLKSDDDFDLPASGGSVKALGCVNDDDDDKKALCLVAPQSLADVAAGTLATDGRVLYVPSAMDLQRGEGLVGGRGELLLAMEQVLSSLPNKKEAATLTVVVPDGVSIKDAQASLYQAVEPLLGQLSSSSSSPKTLSSGGVASSLSDVFGGGVFFVALQDARDKVWKSDARQANVVTDTAALADAAEPYANSVVSTTASPADMAAARLWADTLTALVEDGVETVSQAMTHEDGGGPKLVPAFGELCTAALHSAATEATKRFSSSALPAAQRQAYLQTLSSNLSLRLSDLVQSQVELQFAASLADFRKKLSGVLISPNLKQDMHTKVANPCLQEFRQAVQGLTFSGQKEDVVGPAVAYFSRTIRQEIAQRLLKAQAAGKFRPLPRKGVTVGFHWLLPKPFGNDYRQEPWKVHATDNMVYIPSGSSGSGVTEVAPGNVQKGDWRNQVVPSPVGNDLIYTQG